jgi:hypothetical protein
MVCACYEGVGEVFFFIEIAWRLDFLAKKTKCLIFHPRMWC